MEILTPSTDDAHFFFPVLTPANWHNRLRRWPGRRESRHPTARFGRASKDSSNQDGLKPVSDRRSSGPAGDDSSGRITNFEPWMIDPQPRAGMAGGGTGAGDGAIYAGGPVAAGEHQRKFPLIRELGSSSAAEPPPCTFIMS